MPFLSSQRNMFANIKLFSTVFAISLITSQIAAQSNVLNLYSLMSY